jgi:DNA repair protein RadC
VTYSLRISDLPSSERPRERLMAIGCGNLSTAELLAILLGTGQGAGKLSALGLAQYLLQTLAQGELDPVSQLRQVNLTDLTQIKGIGPAKATTILAALELGKRVHQSRPPDLAVVDDPAVAAAALGSELMWQTQEKFAVLLLDIRNRMLGSRVIFVGSATETLANPRDIFREAIRQGSTRIIVAHNHPSGDTQPSEADLKLTRRLLQGAAWLDLPLLDHLILGNGTFTSMRQITDLWSEVPQE